MQYKGDNKKRKIHTIIYIASFVNTTTNKSSL